MVGTRSQYANNTSIILVLAFILTSYFQLASAYAGGMIGVDYGLNGDNLLTPKQTVRLLCSKGIRRVRTYEARPDVLQAFANSGIDLVIGVPNEDVPKLADNLEEAFNWLINYVVPFPTSGISAIIVGNEWLSDSSKNHSLLVPAMQNIYDALSTLQFFYIYLSGIKVSTSHALDVLSNPSFPPSIATFADTCVAVMRPLLDFLVDTGSYFMVNIFPYFAYLGDEGVSLAFVLFESTEVVRDPNTGLNYTNLFDLQLDAVYAAVTSLLSSPPPSPLPCDCNSSEVGKAFSAQDIHTAATHRGQRRPSVVTGESGWPSGSSGTSTPPGRGHRQSTTAFSTTTMSSLSSNAGAHQKDRNHHANRQNSTRVAATSLPSTKLTSSATPSSSLKTSALENAANMEAQRAVDAAAKAQLLAEYKRCECEAATPENARTYNQNLIRHVLQVKGTPANPNTPIRAYIFAIFDEDLKQPPGTEQHFGLFYPNGTAVYPINFHDRG